MQVYTMAKSYASYQDEAIVRQKYAFRALKQKFNIDDIREFESDIADKDKDINGIDAEIDLISGDSNTVAIKTRSTHKRHLDYIDIPLRVAGRKGGESKEWLNFVDTSREIADLLVFIVFGKDGDVLFEYVIDFDKLRDIYTAGRKKNLLVEGYGFTQFYITDDLNTTIKPSNNTQYNEVFAFLDLDDVNKLDDDVLLYVNN